VGPALRRLRTFAGIRQKSATTAFLSARPCVAVVISQSDRPFGPARQDGNAKARCAVTNEPKGLRERIAPDFRFCHKSADSMHVSM